MNDVIGICLVILLMVFIARAAYCRGYCNGMAWAKKHLYDEYDAEEHQ